MEKILPLLLAALKAEKGRDKARAATLVLVGFVAFQQIRMDTRLAIVETLLRDRPGVTGPGIVTPAVSRTNQLARAK